jgi:hypothetical protein
MPLASVIDLDPLAPPAGRACEPACSRHEAARSFAARLRAYAPPLARRWRVVANRANERERYNARGPSGEKANIFFLTTQSALDAWARRH